MYNDLKDRLNEIQYEGAPKPVKTPKWVMGLAIALVVLIIVMIIAGTVVVVKVLNTVTDSVTSAADTGGYTQEDSTNRFDRNDRYQNSNKETVPFKYGTVNGTSYYSEFSGVSFDAPDDWNMQGYENNKYANTVSSRDMSASSRDLMTTVSVTYSSMAAHSYKKVEDALESQKQVATSVENNSMVDDNVREKVGGRSFVGIRYKKEIPNKTYYIQSMVTEVKGYAMEIYIEADTEKEIEKVIKMFK